MMYAFSFLVRFLRFAPRSLVRKSKRGDYERQALRVVSFSCSAKGPSEPKDSPSGLAICSSIEGAAFDGIFPRVARIGDELNDNGQKKGLQRGVEFRAFRRNAYIKWDVAKW